MEGRVIEFYGKTFWIGIQIAGSPMNRIRGVPYQILSLNSDCRMRESNSESKDRTTWIIDV